QGRKHASPPWNISAPRGVFMKLRALEALEDRPRKTMACPTGKCTFVAGIVTSEIADQGVLGDYAFPQAGNPGV
ncbi:MAG: hypothetical protein ABSG84_18820, partial [Acidobacteriaceae bacterium]